MVNTDKSQTEMTDKRKKRQIKINGYLCNLIRHNDSKEQKRKKAEMTKKDQITR